MADKAWKQFERRVAAYFGGVRAALSGGNGKVTRADVIHDRLYVEAKQRKRHAVVTLWDDTKEKAKLEGKVPVVALSEKGRPGFWVMVHSSDLTRVAREVHPIDKTEGDTCSRSTTSSAARAAETFELTHPASGARAERP